MAASDREIQEIFQTELGYLPDAAALEHYRTTGLEGDDLLKSIRHTASLDNTIFDDPAMAAFARQQRRQRTTIDLNKQQESAEIVRNRDIASRILDRQQNKNLQAVDRDFSSRGMTRAGRRTIDRANVVADTNLVRQQQEASASDRLADVNRRANDSIADLSRQRDEQEIAARDRLTDQSIRSEQLRRLANG